MTIHDLIDTGSYDNKPYCINIRGTNGSGKSSLARQFIQDGFQHIYVEGMKNPAFTYSKDYNVLVLGHYKTACGGCDALVKAQIVRLLKLAWMTTCNIVFEGVLVSDSGNPYADYMKELNDTLKPRKWGFAYLDLPLEVCLARIYKRNGGKQIKEDLVAAKHKNQVKYRSLHESRGDCIVLTLDATQPPDIMANQFQKLMSEVGYESIRGIRHTV